MPEQQLTWKKTDQYGIWVSTLGEATDRHGVSLVPHMVNGDLRVTCQFEGAPRSFSLKRLVAEAFIPKPFVGNTGLIDCINGDTTDVRAANLVWKRREQRNRGAHREPGVSFNKETKKWKVYAIINRVNFHIGYYSEKDAAIVARDKAYTMISEGVPIEDIRARLSENLRDCPREPRVSPTSTGPIKIRARPPVATKVRGSSWKDWPETKKMLADIGGG